MFQRDSSPSKGHFGSKYPHTPPVGSADARVEVQFSSHRSWLFTYPIVWPTVGVQVAPWIYWPGHLVALPRAGRQQHLGRVVY